LLRKIKSGQVIWRLSAHSDFRIVEVPMTKATRHDKSAPASMWPDGSPIFNGWPIASPTTPMTAMALFNLNAMCASLQAARAILDASRETMRKQQDMAIEAWRAQLDQFTAASSSPPTDQAREYYNPMSAAAGVFQQMSNAAMQAQRDALRPFADASKPH
jgi:hypothetical protein